MSENLELNVYFWAFRDRKLSETGGLYPGATVKFRAIDFNSRSDLKSVMRADDISRFDLPVYFGEFVGALITRDNFRRPSKFEKLEAPVNRIESQIGMLSAMNDSLKKRGIKLLVVPTPFKEEIVPSVKELQPGSKEFMKSRTNLVEALKLKNIPVLDLAPVFTKVSDPSSLYYADGRVDDHHPNDDGLKLTASAIAEYLIKEFKYSVETPVKFTFKKAQFGEQNQYSATQVIHDGHLIDIWPPAEVVVLGDSVTLWPQGSYYGSVDGASLPCQLRAELGLRCSSFTVSGGGPSMPRLLKGSPEALGKAKICIFVFAPYYAWKKEPRMWDPVEF